MTDTIIRTAQTAEPQRTASVAAAPTRRNGMAPWPVTWSDARRIGAVALAIFLATVAVGFLITQFVAGTAVGAADRSVNFWLAELRSPTWNRLTDWGSAFSDTITIVILLAVLVPLLAWVTKRWHASVLLAGAVAFETLVFVTASLVVGRERPPVDQLDMSPPTASFPSGHTGAAVAFYIGLVVLVFWWTRHRGARALAVATFGLVPVVVAISRLYRGMHYPSDVIFGAAIGLASVALFASMLRGDRNRERIRPGDGEADTDRPIDSDWQVDSDRALESVR